MAYCTNVKAGQLVCSVNGEPIMDWASRTSRAHGNAARISNLYHALSSLAHYKAPDLAIDAAIAPERPPQLMPEHGVSCKDCKCWAINSDSVHQQILPS